MMLRAKGIRRIAVSGSVSVVRQLRDAGLLDELLLFVHTATAGMGLRLFDDGAPARHLKLLSAQLFRQVWCPVTSSTRRIRSRPHRRRRELRRSFAPKSSTSRPLLSPISTTGLRKGVVDQGLS